MVNLPVQFQYRDYPTLGVTPKQAKFIDADSLSTSTQLVVQTSRTPAGHHQQWKRFELLDGTSFANPRLRWSTKYLPAAVSPGRATSPKPQTSSHIAKFVLDIIYLSEAGDYRFAMRVNRAAVSIVTTDQASFLLLYLTDVCEWDSPSGGNYDNHKYKPTNWLKLPQTLKLFAKDANEFLKLKSETIALCSSQNIITWIPQLGEKFKKAMEPSNTETVLTEGEKKDTIANYRKSEFLDKLAARMSTPKPDDQIENPFTFEDAGLSTAKPPLQASSDIDLRSERRRSLQIPLGRSYKKHSFATSPSPETEINPNTSAPHKCTTEGDIFIRAASLSPPNNQDDHNNSSNKTDIPSSHRNSIIKLGKRVAPASPSLSPASERPHKRFSRWGPDLNIGFSEDEQRRISMGQDVEVVPKSSPPLRVRTDLQRPTSYPPANYPSTPTSLSPEDKRNSFADQLTAVTAASCAQLQPDAIVIKAQPDYTWTINGRDLDVEFKRKLVISEAIVLQWAEEFDIRRGQRTPVNLDRITIVLDKDSLEKKPRDEGKD
ncbi:hypothetical protein AA313_de0208179 [Arthrobotrys entomopaga]|nr:hypothetical protein AA313_de0208179 [Arthrobotrys entomopaga]